MHARDEHGRNTGQAILLVLAVAVLVTTSVMALAALALRVQRHEQAQVAADAAALAGIDGGRPAAAALAVANGGVLVRFQVVGADVVVEVAVGSAHAAARATRAP